MTIAEIVNKSLILKNLLTAQHLCDIIEYNGKLLERRNLLEKDRFIQFSYALNEAQKSIGRIKCKKMDTYGLGSAHTLCVCLLQDNPEGLTKTELAHLCGVDKAQISRVISELQDKELVAISDPCLHYRQKYLLTEKGTPIADEIREIVLKINSYVSESIPPEHIAIFYSTFNTICDNLKKAEKLF